MPNGTEVLEGGLATAVSECFGLFFERGPKDGERFRDRSDNMIKKRC
jgi:hypothetical protein